MGPDWLDWASTVTASSKTATTSRQRYQIFMENAQQNGTADRFFSTNVSPIKVCYRTSHINASVLPSESLKKVIHNS
jgi:hypothetical protein